MKSGPIHIDIYTCITSSYDSDGYLSLQPDYPGQEGGQPHEAIFPLGMQSRPLDPVVDNTGKVATGCPMVAFWENDQALLMPFGDSRVVAGLPALDKGDTMFHGLKAPNFLRFQAGGTITLFTTADGTATGQSMTFTMGQLAGDRIGTERVGPWGRESFDSTGWHIVTHSKAAIDLGGVAGIPFPLDSFSSYFKVTASSAHLNATMVALGPGGAVSPLALAGAPFTTVLTSLSAALTALNAAMVAIPAGVTPATVPAGVAALATAIGTATTAIGSAVTALGAGVIAIPSNCAVST